MKCCNKCNKDLNDNCFIAENGEYLCSECSKGVKPVDRGGTPTYV
ncbi:MAG: hypothetical protein ACRDDY_19525 [Clostridium sp.]